MKEKKFYAYFVPRGERSGVSSDWKKVEKLVQGVKGARYRGFSTKKEAEEWLGKGAKYETRSRNYELRSKKYKKKELAAGIYFDAGTGRGAGVEVSITDERGQDLLAEIIEPELINRFGKHLIADKAATNNYGELLACSYALQLALKKGVKKVFGDSNLVIEFWSRGHVKKKSVAVKTYELSLEVARLREKFEKDGGAMAYISGDHNPADLGFHK